MNLIAKTLHGLEPILMEELAALGAKNLTPLKRAVQFEGDFRLLYRANLELRTAMRILWPIARFKARNEADLYRQIRRTRWNEYMKVNETLAIDGVAHSDTFRHSKYVALKTKDAIVDQFRDETGRRPNVNVANPDLRINVHITENDVTVSLDSSGESLHKRGYRHEILEAPISEVLAAGMILISGWRGDRTFIDPMCGSGTILTEAALIACNLPAQMHRKHYGFQKWQNYKPELWKEVYDAAMAKKKLPDHPILGFDKNFQAVRVTQRNLEASGLEDVVTVKRRLFEKLIPPPGGGVMITNPPYDERIKDDDINGLYTMIGDQLKKEFTDYDAWLISSNNDAIKHIGLRHSAKIPMFNGALDCRLMKYEMYEGSKKAKHMKK